ncbi:acyltransferase-domain-containing protein, partial [Catenaria anguillulae PL171]
VDDPVMWGLLKNRTFVSRIDDLRWTLGAQELCFQNLPLSWFFTCGKAIPIIRGKGVYQVAMDYAVDRLNHGNWVHIFPEGRVHQEDTMLPFKWGVGRLIIDSKLPPLVVPIYHQGFAKMHPLNGGWVPNPFASALHVTIGDAIDTAPWRGQGESLTSYLGANAASTQPPADVLASPRLHRQWITAQLQERMAEMQTKVMGKRPKMVEAGDAEVGKAPWN